MADRVSGSADLLVTVADATRFVIQVYDLAAWQQELALEFERELKEVYSSITGSSQIALGVDSGSLENAVLNAFAAIAESDFERLDRMGILGRVMSAAQGRYTPRGTVAYWGEEKSAPDPADTVRTAEKYASALAAKAWLDEGILTVKREISEAALRRESLEKRDKLVQTEENLAEIRSEMQELVNQYRAGLITKEAAGGSADLLRIKKNVLESQHKAYAAAFEGELRRITATLSEAEDFLALILKLDNFINTSPRAAELYCMIFEQIDFVAHTAKPKAVAILSDIGI